MIPFIDENYENDNGDRTLMARDDAGSAAASYFMLVEEKGSPIFKKYIIANPDGLNPSFLNLDQWTKDKPDLKFHVSVNSEYLPTSEGFLEILTESNYPWLTHDFQVFESISTKDMPLTSFDRGLKFIFGIE